MWPCSREVTKLGETYSLGFKASSYSNDIEIGCDNMLHVTQYMELCLHYSYRHIKMYHSSETIEHEEMKMVNHRPSFSSISIFMSMLYIALVSWTCSSMSSNLQIMLNVQPAHHHNTSLQIWLQMTWNPYTFHSLVPSHLAILRVVWTSQQSEE